MYSIESLDVMRCADRVELLVELAHFLESVKEAKEPKVGAALGKSALEVAIAITEEIRRKQKE